MYRLARSREAGQGSGPPGQVGSVTSLREHWSQLLLRAVTFFFSVEGSPLARIGLFAAAVCFASGRLFSDFLVFLAIAILTKGLGGGAFSL